MKKLKMSAQHFQSTGGEGKMGGRKSQVDKFNAKWSKLGMDTKAIYEPKQKSSLYEEGVEELMSKGNIKEAAVVFSREGMSAFANMFGNSVENAVEKVLTTRIEYITQSMAIKMESLIEEKMLEMLEGMTLGMKQMTEEVPQAPKEEYTKTYLKALEEELTKKLDLEDLFGKVYPVAKTNTVRDNHIVPAQLDVEEEFTTELVAEKTLNSEKPTVKNSVQREKIKINGNNWYYRLLDEGEMGMHKSKELKVLSSTKADLAIAYPYVIAMMKANPGEIRSSDVTRTMHYHFNIKVTNPTAVFNYAMKKNSSIEKVGFGFYTYEEKNFEPTI